jgi:hypothetical protein
VHGLRHDNYAPSGSKKAEFGNHRPLTRLAENAAQGLRLARDRFGDLVAPVFVPPWNRITPALVEQLPDLGFRGLSTFGERPAREPASGLVQVNTHIDPIAWREGASLQDISVLMNSLAQAIGRVGESNGNEPEPIGLLTHHLLHDHAVWEFCEELLAHLADHPGIRFVDPVMMFVGAQTASV